MTVYNPMKSLLIALTLLIMPVSVQAVSVEVQYTIGVKAPKIPAKVKSVVKATAVPKKPQVVLAVVQTGKEEVASMIRERFGRDGEIATAIFRAESGLRSNAQGWNCWYSAGGEVKDSKTSDGDYSAACKVEDRGRAWSVDCGVAQINFPGQTCPIESLNVNWNIQRAFEWKYSRCNCFGAWAAYTNGSYKQFLTN